jgi:hypothetical protein
MRQALLLFSWLYPATAFGQAILLEEGGTERARSPNISMELLDPTARTRFHFTTRFTFSDAVETFSDSAIATFEADAVVRIIEGVGISFGLPFALDAPMPGADTFFIGNFHLGVEGGGVIRFDDKRAADPGAPRLGLGGGLDVYAPTARALENNGNESDRMALVRETRSYEQELYLERTTAFRLRGHADFAVSIVVLELELGLTPGFDIQDELDFLMLFSWAGRVAVLPIDQLEPFVEIGSSLQVAGDPLNGHELDTPVRLTLGLRGHFSGFDPALFVSFDFSEGGVVFGVDVAAAFRTESRGASERDPLDFRP